MRAYILLAILVVMTTLGCKNPTANLQPLDLLEHGLPLKILTPIGVETTVNDLGILKDVTIKNDDGYSIQIFESEAKQLNASSVAAGLKAEIEASEFFSKMIEEDETGFIYEKKIDESYINYDFRHVKIYGDKQYVIRTGLSKQYTLDQVEMMYQSVQ